MRRAHPARAMFFATTAASFGQLTSRSVSLSARLSVCSVCLSVLLSVPLSAVCRLHLTAMNFSAFQHFHRKLLAKNGRHNCHRRAEQEKAKDIWKGNTIDTKICVKRRKEATIKNRKRETKKERGREKAGHTKRKQQLTISRRLSLKGCQVGKK